MTDYRAYFVEREKHFIGYRGFVCQDDGEAIEKAKELFEGPSIELWWPSGFGADVALSEVP